MTYQEIICDANRLYRAYKAAINSDNDWKESAQRFAADHLTYIFALRDDLINQTYQNGPVNEFELHERGRIRPISSLAVPDRIVRHVLCDDILMPEIRKKIIYDNSASITGRGLHFARKRIETHLHKYYREHGTDGYILLGDFSKFYDNIIHETAKKQLLDLVGNDEYIAWLLSVIFSGFTVDVSYMSDEEYERCMDEPFSKLKHRTVPVELLTGEKYMQKSVNIGDQLSQLVGIYYPNDIDTYVKYVLGRKYYGRYQDDFYVIGESKRELAEVLTGIIRSANGLGIHINGKKTKIVPLGQRFKYLQFRYYLKTDGKIVKQINPERVTVMRRKLKKLAVKVKNGDIPYGNVEGMFRSWMGEFHKVLSVKQRTGLLELYSGLFGKRISIKHGKMIFDNIGTEDAYENKFTV